MTIRSSSCLLEVGHGDQGSGSMVRVMAFLVRAQAAVRPLVVMKSIGWEVRP